MEYEQFASKDEEIQCLRKRLQDCQIELEEYQESSRELEAELETQLTNSEKRNAELKSQNHRLQNENENLKSKLTNLTGQTSEQIMELQKQLNETQICNAKLTRCIRELEQSNDDLERAKRALHASLDDFEKKLNHQIEKNVLLENELGEKEQLEEIIQRLKDEARDLKQELLVQQQTPTSYKSSSVEQEMAMSEKNELKQCGLPLRPSALYSPYASSATNSNPNSNNEMNSTTKNNSKLIGECKLGQQTASSTANELAGSVLSPSTRISVLNIVSDLLRKVGALESRLNQSNQCKAAGVVTSSASAPSPIKNGLNGHSFN